MQLKEALFVLGNWVQREPQCSGQEQEYFSCSIQEAPWVFLLSLAGVS